MIQPPSDAEILSSIFYTLEQKKTQRWGKGLRHAIIITHYQGSFQGFKCGEDAFQWLKIMRKYFSYNIQIFLNIA